MRKMPILFIFMSLFFPLTSGTASGADYSLEELFKLALERSERIKLVEEDLYIAGIGKDRAVSVLTPKLSAFGELRRYSEERLKGGQVLQPETSSTWGLKIEQSMSMAGRELTGLRISNGKIQKSEYDLRAVKEEYLFNVASAYYDVLKAKRAIEIAKANLQRLRAYKNAVELRLKVGELQKQHS